MCLVVVVVVVVLWLCCAFVSAASYIQQAHLTIFTLKYRQ